MPKDSQNVYLNPHAYFTSRTLQDCSGIPTSLSELDQIPLNEFCYPFLVVQNQCNTHVQMKNGTLRTLKLVNSLDVHNLLSKRSLEITGGDFVPTNNTMQIYLNPGHAFFGISCRSCNREGSAFDKRVGFYPDSNPPSGILYDEEREGKAYSDENNFLKLVIPINDEQAKQLFEKIQEIESSNFSYDVYLRNCLDVVQETFVALFPKRHFLDYFTEEQLQVFPLESQLAIQYAIYEHQYNCPVRALLSGANAIVGMVTYILPNALARICAPLLDKITFGFSPMHVLSYEDFKDLLAYMGT